MKIETMVMPLMNDDCKNGDNFECTTDTDYDDDRKNADINESVQKTSPDSVVYSKNADKYESFQDTTDFDDDSKNADKYESLQETMKGINDDENGTDNIVCPSYY